MNHHCTSDHVMMRMDCVDGDMPRLVGQGISKGNNATGVNYKEIVNS